MTYFSVFQTYVNAMNEKIKKQVSQIKATVIKAHM